MCQQEITDPFGGHSAKPMMDGRVCDSCNGTVVRMRADRESTHKAKRIRLSEQQWERIAGVYERERDAERDRIKFLDEHIDYLEARERYFAREVNKMRKLDPEMGFSDAWGVIYDRVEEDSYMSEAEVNNRLNQELEEAAKQECRRKQLLPSLRLDLLTQIHALEDTTHKGFSTFREIDRLTQQLAKTEQEMRTNLGVD
jgi:hypothetical protein